MAKASTSVTTYMVSAVGLVPKVQALYSITFRGAPGYQLRFEAKLPGTRMQLAPVMMHFRYKTAFGAEVPEAYETLLLDALIGDATLFARHDFAETAWQLITPVHERWASAGGSALPTYEAGEWGPSEADHLLAREGHRWRTL